MMLSILGRAIVRLAAAHERRQAFDDLSRLSDHHLRDIGIEPGAIRETIRDRELPVDLPDRGRGLGRQAFFPRPGTSRGASR